MEYATPDRILPYCTCIMVGLVLLAIYAAALHYKFWKSNLRGTPLSGVYPKVRLVLWLLGVAVVGLYSIVVLWLFGYWYQLLTDLFKD
jgi:hypothetical protein